MKILNYLLLGVGALVVLAGAVLAYVAATFDPNAYKPQIVQAVKDRTQRTLKLEGDIRLALFPAIGARLGKASLSERASEREFAGVDDLRVAVKLMPLLSGQVVVDAVEVKGLRANLVRYKDGRTNADDLTGAADKPPAAAAPAAAPPLRVDIDHVTVENAALTYTDQASGVRYALSRLNLKTGRIAPGVPTRVELSGAVQANEPGIDATLDLKTRLSADPHQQHYALEDLALEVRGAAAGVTNLVLKASGAASAKPGAGEFAANRLSVAVTGNRGKDALDVKLDAPRLDIAANRASGDKLALSARISGPGGTTAVNLALPGIEGTADAFKSAAMTLDLDVKQGDLALKAKLASPLSGNARARQLSLPQLKASISASGPNLPGKSIAGELAGSAALDAAKRTAQANVAGKVSDSGVKAQIGVAAFAPLALTFNVDIDQLDLDRYLGPPSAQKPPEKPFDLSALRELRANGTLRVGSLKVNNIKATNVRLDVRAGGGRVDVNPLAASLYQGSLAGSAAINAAPATPSFALRHSLNGVSVGPLLKDLADNDALEGRGNVTLDVTTQGSTVGALKKALNGSAAIKLADGAVRGIDIAGSIRSAKAKLGALSGEQTQAADKSQKTDFSELTATFNIKNGVAYNNDLSLKSPLLRVGGEGSIDIGNDALNYLVRASIVATSKGQGGRDVSDLRGLTVPVKVSGPLASPSYRLDFGAMVTDGVKQKAEDALRGQLEKRLGGGSAAPAAGKEAPGSGGGSARDALRGLFGR
jgi:AsmA protein